jgi:hypothetical protein
MPRKITGPDVVTHHRGKGMRKSTTVVQFKLRIREGLRRKVEAAAIRNEVSANAEMAARLENSFDADAGAQLDAVVTQATKVLANIDWEIWKNVDLLHELDRASIELILLCKKRLPDDPELATAIDRVNRALQVQGRALGVSPKPLVAME